MASSHIWKKAAKTLDHELIMIDGYVNIAADATVVSDTLPGASVARTGTGEYTITLDDTYEALRGCNIMVLASTAVDLVPQLKSQTVATTKLIVFRLLAGASATDPTEACGVYIHLVLKNSDV